MYFIYGIITNIIILFSPLIFFRILKREDQKDFSKNIPLTQLKIVQNYLDTCCKRGNDRVLFQF